MLMILAANSSPVTLCTHLRTMEKAPLRREKTDQLMEMQAHKINREIYILVDDE
jgi:hypothetical protein